MSDGLMSIPQQHTPDDGDGFDLLGSLSTPDQESAEQESAPEPLATRIPPPQPAAPQDVDAGSDSAPADRAAAADRAAVEDAAAATAAIRPPAPATFAAEQVVDVTCPGCGAMSQVDAARRFADDFCRHCDYPLFWAVERVALPVDQGGDSGLRRLPGTAGLAALAALQCPACTEPNPPSAVQCGRCGADLHPKAVTVEAAPEPIVEVVAEPEPAGTPWWIWAMGTALLCVIVSGVIALILM